jgi:type I restriction enzyme S subunit
MENELLEETGYVGDIPEGWKWVKLGDLVEIIKGKKPENLIENPSKNTLPYLTAEYLRYKTPNQFVDIEKEKKLPVCEKDDIILIWDGSQAGQVFTGSKGILASTMVKIIPNLDIVNKAYLYFFLTTKFEYLNTQTTGSAIPHVNKNAFLNLPILLPPLPEQKAIAEVLSSMDDKIELLHRQNKTLEEMAMTLFRQWFIEPTKDGLPEGWEEVSLGEFIKEVLSGDWGKDKPEGEYKVAVNCIRGTDISDLQNGLPKKLLSDF